MSTTKSKEMMVYEALSHDLEAAQSHVMDLYTQARDSEALHAAAAMKEFVVKARYKQAPDPVQLAGERFITALRSKMPDEQVVAYLDQAARALGAQDATAGAGTLQSDERMTTKAQAAALFTKAALGAAALDALTGEAPPTRPVGATADDWMVSIGEALDNQAREQARFDAWLGDRGRRD